ncbi:RNA polymerase subunit sigma-70, partial [Mesorhizobium sp. M3A.F.Ca.ET.175.01.1.1]
RAGLLARLGNTKHAAQSYDRAIGLERDPALRRFLQDEKAKLSRN